MKKIVAFLLALSMVLAMAACGSQAPAATTEAPKTDAPAGETTAAPAETEAPENLTETQKIIKEAEGMTLAGRIRCGLLPAAYQPRAVPLQRAGVIPDARCVCSGASGRSAR